MDTVKLARAAMTDEERAEYDRLKRAHDRPGPHIVTKIYIATGIVVAGVTAAVVLTIISTGGTGFWPTFWFVTWCVCAFGGLLAAAVASTVSKRRHGRRAELLATAASRLPDPRTPAEPGVASERGVDWSRYPVTGVYDPQAYYERGGRSTARAMQAWGDIDYETYRSNIE